MKIQQAQTSCNHFHEVVVPNLSSKQQQLILSAMFTEYAYTIGELAKLTGLPNSTISARRNEMIGHSLKLGKNRPCRISKITCQTVVRAYA